MEQCHIDEPGSVLPTVVEPHTDDPILLAARAAVLDLGLRRTTLAEVARRAGVSRMTLYRQYGDLDAIVSALLTAEFTGTFEAVAVQVAELPSALERLVVAAAAVAVAISEHPLYRRVLDVDPELLLPLITDRLGSTQRIGREIIADLIKQGQSDGSVREVDPQLAAAVLGVALQSFVFSARVMGTVAGDVQGELRRLITGYLTPLPTVDGAR